MRLEQALIMAPRFGWTCGCYAKGRDGSFWVAWVSCVVVFIG